MGWLFGWDTKKDLIKHRVKRERSKTGTTWTCLAHCYRGNRFSGVLWSVWARRSNDGDEVRYIACDLLRCVPQKEDSGCGWWGYKDMEEVAHPYYYSCPISYLDMAPVACPEWREKVREYHQKHYRSLEKGATYKLAPGFSIGGDGRAEVTIVSLRPLRATSNGYPIRVKRKHLAEKCERE